MAVTPLIDAIDPDAPLAQRHLWLIDAMRWVRGDEKDVQASLARVREFLDSVQADPELQQRWRRWWAPGL